MPNKLIQESWMFMLLVLANTWQHTWLCNMYWFKRTRVHNPLHFIFGSVSNSSPLNPCLCKIPHSPSLNPYFCFFFVIIFLSTSSICAMEITSGYRNIIASVINYSGPLSPFSTSVSVTGVTLSR